MSEIDLHAANTGRSIQAAERDMLDKDGAVHPRVEQLVASQVSSVTPEEKDEFLAALIEHGVVAKACQRIGISRMAANRIRKRDPEFAWKWKEILEAWVDNIEAVLLKQCLDPSPANTIARFFVLKAALPKYRETVQAAQPREQHRVHVVVELSRRDGTIVDAVDAEVVGADVPAGGQEPSD